MPAPTTAELLQLQPRSFMDLPVAEPATSFFNRPRDNRNPVDQRYQQAMEQQQAEEAARRLTESLSAIDPLDAQAPVLRYQAVAQNPNAAATQQGRAILGAFDDAMRQPARPKDDTQTLIDQLYRSGATDEEIQTYITPDGTLNRGAAQRRIGMGRPAEVKAEDQGLKEVKAALEFLNDPILSGTMNPAQRTALIQQWTNKAQSLMGGVAPEVPTAAPAPAPVAPAPTPTGFTPSEEQRLKVEALRQKMLGM